MKQVLLLCVFAVAAASIAKSDLERIDRMVQSVNKVEGQFHGVHNSVAGAVKSNIAQIREDLERMKVVPDAKREKLIEAVHLRLQALREQKKESMDLEKKAHPSKTHVSKPLSKKPSTHLSKAKPLSKKPSAPLSKSHSLRQAALRDLEKVQQAVNNKHMPVAKKENIRDNIHSMKKDLDEMEAADPARRARLMSAVKLRMTALKSQMDSTESKAHALPSKAHALPSKVHALPSKTHSIVSKVHALPSKAHSVNHNKYQTVATDLTNVEHDVQAAHVPASLKTNIKDNLAHMRTDLTELERNPAEKRHADLVEALKLRMRALKSQIETMHKEEKAPVADLEKVPSLSVQNDIISNLDVMMKDMHRMGKGDNVGNMRKALGLRMKALNAQLGFTQETRI